LTGIFWRDTLFSLALQGAGGGPVSGSRYNPAARRYNKEVYIVKSEYARQSRRKDNPFSAVVNYFLLIGNFFTPPPPPPTVYKLS
jgi:hypothetical protein